MPIKLERIVNIPGNFAPQEKEYIYDLVKSFRIRIADDIPKKNVLNEHKFTFTDEQVFGFLNEAVNDINMSFAPITNYDLFGMYSVSQRTPGLIAVGAVIIALIHEGILETKNYMEYNDSGISVNMFGKTGLYQSWLQMLIQNYERDKLSLKEYLFASSQWFYGIDTDYGYQGMYGEWY